MSAISAVFGLADFRRLFAGVTTSQLGDQFALIATPWLVLQLTGDPLALGLVLALEEGAPRALFMLLGGAVTDRFSPRLVMLATDLIRMVLAGLLAAAIFSGQIEMWMVYAFALGIGLVAGFAVPAGNSIVPSVVEQDDLQTGNAAVMGGGQVAGFIGPVIAGLLIGALSGGLTGVGIAFFIDALTFGFSALMLFRIAPHPAAETEQEGAMLTAVREGLKYVLTRPTLRITLLIIAAINLVFVGPIMVGIPVLAETRLAEGAGAFGLLMSAFAGGNLAGYVLAGVMHQPAASTVRRIVLSLLAGLAATLALLGLSASTWLDACALAVIGLGNGFMTIVLISAIQSAAPKALLGRIMGLFMFSSMGLVPVSQAVAGAVSRWDVTGLFVLAAMLMAAVAIWVSFQPAVSKLTGGLSEQHELVPPAGQTA